MIHKIEVFCVTCLLKIVYIFCSRYTDILRWEVSLPPLILTIESTKLHISPVVDEIKKWAVMGHEVFSSILEKLCLFDADISKYSLSQWNSHFCISMKK